MPYCNFATIGLSEMNVKSLRRQVKGRGTIKARKINISVTKSMKTCRHNNSKHGCHIADVVRGASKGRRAASTKYSHWLPCPLPLPSEHTRGGSSTYQTVVERHFGCDVVALCDELIFACLCGVRLKWQERQDGLGLTKVIVEARRS
jgi:hypothetical protein